MANPIAFTPRPVDPRDGLRKKLDAAPLEHAEALLVAYDVIQAAHDEGILDLLHGMVKHKNTVFEHLAEAAKMQESVDALRNVISLGKMLGSIEPETMSCLTASLSSSSNPKEEAPLSLVGLFRRVTSVEGRRGLTIMVKLLVALGTRRFAGPNATQMTKAISRP